MVQVADAGLERADGLEKTFLKIGTDAHDLAGGLHLGAEGVGGVGEFVKGEAGEFGDDVIEARLNGGRAAGDGNLLQGHAHGDLGRDAGNGIAAGLGGEGGGAGDAGVDLNQEILAGIRIQGELDIAAALDLQLADDADGTVVEHFEVAVVQTQNRGHDDGITRVHADGIDVFHAADGDGGVVGVTHDLKLDLLITPDALFDQHLVDGRESEGVGADGDQLVLVVGKAAAGAA